MDGGRRRRFFLVFFFPVSPPRLPTTVISALATAERFSLSILSLSLHGRTWHTFISHEILSLSLLCRFELLLYRTKLEIPLPVIGGGDTFESTHRHIHYFLEEHCRRLGIGLEKKELLASNCTFSIYLVIEHIRDLDNCGSRWQREKKS
jgi:hypothetical protein